MKHTPTVEQVRIWFSLSDSITDEIIENIISSSTVELSMDFGNCILNKIQESESEYLMKLKICTILQEMSLGSSLPGSQRDLVSKSVDGVSWSFVSNALGLISTETCLQKYLRLRDNLLKSIRRPGIIK